MLESQSHAVEHVDQRLRVLSHVVADARAELAEVRRRQSDLADTEAALVVAIEVRSRRVDDLLDERLRAAAPARRAARRAPVPAGRPAASDGHGIRGTRAASRSWPTRPASVSGTSRRATTTGPPEPTAGARSCRRADGPGPPRAPGAGAVPSRSGFAPARDRAATSERPPDRRSSPPCPPAR